MTNNVGMTSIELRQALLDLLTDENLADRYFDMRLSNETLLEDHPFALDIPEKGRLAQPRLVGDTGTTSESVHAMILMLQYHLRNHGSPNHSLTRLRIIYGQALRLAQNAFDHDIYFELITAYGSYITGGCTDYSGEGKSGYMRLEKVFKLVAAAYGIEVERVIIPMQEFIPAQEKLYEQFRGRISLNNKQTATANQ